MANYNYALFDPRPVPAAAEANDKIFAEAEPVGVLGIEVTIPALAARCKLGNIDPQHDGSGSTLAAIEVAYECDLPPDGTTLATVRADLDAFGHMAVSEIRHAGNIENRDLLWSHFLMFAGSGQIGCRSCGKTYEFSNKVVATAVCPASEVGRRIAQIAASDKARTDEWPGPRDLSVAAVEEQAKTAPLAAIAAAVADFRVLVAERVAMVERFLLTGEEPAGYRDRYVGNQLEAARALEAGEATVRVQDGIAVVVSSHRAATAVGYAHAPVVVAMNQQFRGNDGKLDPHLKFTVCQYSAGYVNLAPALAEFRALEPGWGGSPVLIGSTQGASSSFSLDEVVAVVKRHLIAR